MVSYVVGCVESPARGLESAARYPGTAFNNRCGRHCSKSLLGRPFDVPGDCVVSVGGVGASGRTGLRANPLAVAIPCHRVVRQDGDLAGYRWGIARKRALLAREKELSGQVDWSSPASLGADHG